MRSYTAHGRQPWAVGRLRRGRRAGPYAVICFRAGAWPSSWISIFFGAASWGAGIVISSMPLTYVACTWAASVLSFAKTQPARKWLICRL